MVTSLKTSFAWLECCSNAGIQGMVEQDETCIMMEKSAFDIFFALDLVIGPSPKILMSDWSFSNSWAILEVVSKMLVRFDASFNPANWAWIVPYLAVRSVAHGRRVGWKES